jgi:hypothetical protein
MIAFMRGIRMPVSTTRVPAPMRTASNPVGNLVSRSRIMKRARAPVSAKSMRRVLPTWVTQAVVGCAVAPRVRIRRWACWITASTYIGVPDSVWVSKKSQAVSLGVQEVRPGAGGAFGGRVDAGVFERLP